MIGRRVVHPTLFQRLFDNVQLIGSVLVQQIFVAFTYVEHRRRVDLVAQRSGEMSGGGARAVFVRVERQLQFGGAVVPMVIAAPAVGYGREAARTVRQSLQWKITHAQMPVTACTGTVAMRNVVGTTTAD